MLPKTMPFLPKWLYRRYRTTSQCLNSYGCTYVYIIIPGLTGAMIIRYVIAGSLWDLFWKEAHSQITNFPLPLPFSSYLPHRPTPTPPLLSSHIYTGLCRLQHWPHPLHQVLCSPRWRTNWTVCSWRWHAAVSWAESVRATHAGPFCSLH